MAIAVENVIGLIAQSVMQNPEILTKLVEHPYSTVREASGESEVTREEASQVVAGVSEMAAGNAVDFGALGGLAAALLSQNNNSVHALATTLLSSALTAAPAEEAKAEEAPKANNDVLQNLTKLAGKGLIPGVDLSDGLGMDDVIGFAANMLLGKK